MGCCVNFVDILHSPHLALSYQTLNLARQGRNQTCRKWQVASEKNLRASRRSSDL